jgi:CRISPR system Cascade subunit CasD
MARHLILVLEGPLVSFGREAVDARGPVSDFPAASMLTGLLANALGWRREWRERHARLQARLVFAARLDRGGTRLTDFQTAQLAQSDRGWTTRGAPEGRAGGAGTYNSPHIRQREYDADKRVTVALRLHEAQEAPTVEDLAAALDAPARPLFLGRKSCLPSAPLLDRLVDAEGLLDVLATSPPPDDAGPFRVLLPLSEAMERADERRWVTDARDWVSGVHAGGREVLVRTLPRASIPPAASLPAQVGTTA